MEGEIKGRGEGSAGVEQGEGVKDKSGMERMGRGEGEVRRRGGARRMGGWEGWEGLNSTTWMDQYALHVCTYAHHMHVSLCVSQVHLHRQPGTLACCVGLHT